MDPLAELAIPMGVQYGVRANAQAIDPALRQLAVAQEAHDQDNPSLNELATAQQSYGYGAQAGQGVWGGQAGAAPEGSVNIGGRLYPNAEVPPGQEKNPLDQKPAGHQMTVTNGSDVGRYRFNEQGKAVDLSPPDAGTISKVQDLEGKIGEINSNPTLNDMQRQHAMTVLNRELNRVDPGGRARRNSAAMNESPVDRARRQFVKERADGRIETWNPKTQEFKIHEKPVDKAAIAKQQALDKQTALATKLKEDAHKADQKTLEGLDKQLEAHRGKLLASTQKLTAYRDRQFKLLDDSLMAAEPGGMAKDPKGFIEGRADRRRKFEEAAREAGDWPKDEEDIIAASKGHIAELESRRQKHIQKMEGGQLPQQPQGVMPTPGQPAPQQAQAASNDSVPEPVRQAATIPTSELKNLFSNERNRSMENFQHSRDQGSKGGYGRGMQQPQGKGTSGQTPGKIRKVTGVKVGGKVYPTRYNQYTGMHSYWTDDGVRHEVAHSDDKVYSDTYAGNG